MGWRLWFRRYFLMLLIGLRNTARRFFRFKERATLEYPEKVWQEGIRPQVRNGYRGEHRLKKDDLGRMKCVACLMCQTACPAECIRIVATESPWPDRDRIPVQFEIDMLKCIYCGMCEEACPCDAITLTPVYNRVATSRAEKVYDLVRLLENEPSATPVGGSRHGLRV
jgi:NADH-quinone oxidoreductase subunit I